MPHKWCEAKGVQANLEEWGGKPFHPLRIGDWHIGQLAGAEWAKSKRR